MNDFGKVPMLDNKDYQYLADLTIGTPPQKITLVFDTGSSPMWISTYWHDYSCNRSSTCVLNSSRPGSITYGIGFVSGFDGTEVMGIPAINMLNVEMDLILANYIINMPG